MCVYLRDEMVIDSLDLSFPGKTSWRKIREHANLSCISTISSLINFF